MGDKTKRPGAARTLSESSIRAIRKLYRDGCACCGGKPTYKQTGRRFGISNVAVFQIVNRKTGERADPVLVDRTTGRPLSDPIFAPAPGPAADARTKARFEKKSP